MDEVVLGRKLGILTLESIALRRAIPVLDDAARQRIAAGRALVERVVVARVPAYGVNTGSAARRISGSSRPNSPPTTRG